MVDRIVPAATPEVAEAAKAALGLTDDCALSTETFWEWVIEDKFVDPAAADKDKRVTQVLAKLGVSSRTEAAAWAHAHPDA